MSKYRIGFVLEQVLGHVTHSQNIEGLAGHDPELQPFWVPVYYEMSPVEARIPIYNHNWSVRAGWKVRRSLQQLRASSTIDGLFIHTQSVGVLVPDWIQRYPTVVSMDATPHQYDEMGSVYAHHKDSPTIEQFKFYMNQRMFNRASHLVTWTRWAKDGLVTDYKIPAEKITVIPPGIDVERFTSTADNLQIQKGGAVKILFVGGDLTRKGGYLLLEAFRTLRETRPPDSLELHLVTHSEVPQEPGVFAHRDIHPGDVRLIQQFASADIFALPTDGDCLPMVLAEAGASALPSISTRVGGIPEIVIDGRTGYLIQPGDGRALVEGLTRLLDDSALRIRMGSQARQLICSQHSAVENVPRLLALIKAQVDAYRRLPQKSSPIGFEGRKRMADILLTVSGFIPDDIHEQISRGERPQADYLALAEGLPADLLDYGCLHREGSWLSRAAARWLGKNVGLAVEVFQRRKSYPVLFTDGEQVGMPLALLLKLFGRGSKHSNHMMIAHILSVGKKKILFDVFRLQSHIDRFLAYSTYQVEFIRQRWNLPLQKVIWTPFQVDVNFFTPVNVEESPGDGLISSVGLEYRDYPTLIKAVEGLDVQVFLAAASPWSKRADTSRQYPLPANVKVGRLSLGELRSLYARSTLVVVPLYPVEFQAGVTTLLEAMAMGKAVIVTRTKGQTDVVVDGENGVYVHPGDAPALKAAILNLIEDPEKRMRLGMAARKQVVNSMSLERYVQNIRDVAVDLGIQG